MQNHYHHHHLFAWKNTKARICSAISSARHIHENSA